MINKLSFSKKSDEERSDRKDSLGDSIPPLQPSSDMASSKGSTFSMMNISKTLKKPAIGMGMVGSKTLKSMSSGLGAGFNATLGASGLNSGKRSISSLNYILNS